MSTSLLEVSLLGVGTVLRLERDAWSMVKRLRQATNEYAPPHVTWRLHCPVSLMIRSFLLNAGFDCKQYCCLKQMMIIIFCR